MLLTEYLDSFASPGGSTLSNTWLCNEEDATSVVLVKVKPLTILNISTDTMLPAYTHWYTCCPVSASTAPISHALLLPWGPQVIFGGKQEKHQELVNCQENANFPEELPREKKLKRGT